ncbi:hypothetical protein ACLOJK_020759 [Asimina triloba]
MPSPLFLAEERLELGRHCTFQMQFGRGVACTDEMGFQIHGGWIPTTPSKPEPPSRHAQRPHWGDTVSGTGLFGISSFHEGGSQDGASSSDPVVAAAATQSGYISFAEQMQRIGDWEAAVASQTRVSGLEAYTEAFKNATDKWNRMSSSGISAVNGTSSATAAHNEKSTKPTTSCSYHTISNFRTNYTTDHFTTAANSIAYAVTNGSLLFQLAPETFERRRKKTNQEGVEFSFENDKTIQDQKQEDDLPPMFMLHSGMEPVKVQQALSELDVLSTPMNGIHRDCREEGQIDLNKTPLQKRPKRKKHMPKVVVEGKPKRTPRPTTPAKDPLRPKRKYVRKARPKEFAGVPSSDVCQSVDPTSRQAARSCKRVLNFDLEVQVADGCTSTTEVHPNMQNSTTRPDPASCIHDSNHNLHSEARDGNIGINRNSEPIPPLQLAQGLEVVIGEPQPGTSVELMSFLTSLPGDCTSPPNTIKTSPPSPRKSFPIENTEALLLRKKENVETVGSCKSNSGSVPIPLHQNVHVKESDCVIQNVLQSVTSTQPHSTSSQNVLPVVNNSLSKKPKKEYVDGVSLSLSPNPSPSPSPMFPPGAHNICKKRRIDTTHDELAPNASALMASGNGFTQTNMNMVNEIGSNTFMLITSDGKPFPLNSLLNQSMEHSNGFSDASSFICSKPLVGKQNQKVASSSREMLLCASTQNEIEFRQQQGVMARVANARAKETVQNDDMRLLLAAREPNQPQRTSSKVAFAHNKRQEGNVFHDVQWHSGAPKQQEMKNQLAHLATSVFPPFTNQMPPQDLISTSLGKHNVMFATFPSQHIQPRSSNNIFIQDCPISSDIICKPEMMFSGAIILQMDPTGKCAKELECSKFNSSSLMVSAQEQNELVPYARNGSLVPFESPVHSTKAKPLRPIVDVDKETERLWAILVAHSSDEIPGAMDEEKEKWWEEQRRVFRGRVDSFIARMHLVQGSVVDSVVGVFLTQNVSDHLSSSAFMNMAARFPPKSRTNSGAEHPSASEEDKDACKLESYNWQNETPKKIFQNKVNDAELLEGKEIASWNESFSSNMDISSPTSSKDRNSSICKNVTEVCQESQENTTAVVHGTREDACLPGVDDQSGLEGVVSSQNSIISYPNSTIQKTDQNTSILESNFDEDNLILEFNGSMSFMNLLHMDGSNMFEKSCPGDNSRTSSKENSESANGQFETRKCGKGTPYIVMDGLVDASPSTYISDSQKGLLATAQTGGLSEESKHAFHLSSNLAQEANIECQQFGNSWESTDVLSGDGIATDSTDSRWSHMHFQKNVCSLRGDRLGDSQSKGVEVADHQNQVKTTFHGQHLGMQQNHLNAPHHSGDRLFVAESSSTVNKQKIAEINVVQPNASDEASSSKSTLAATTKNSLKRRREKTEIDKTIDFDWENLRQQVCHNHKSKERSSDVMDAVDWEAVRCADVKEISETIKARGMNNMLSERIQQFLNRVASDHGSIDLEWLRDVPPEKAKEYLLSIRGLGLKSTECVRLLTLHHISFPVFCTKRNPNCNACPMRAECRHFASAFASARLALPGSEEKGLISTVSPAAEQGPKVVIHPMELPPTEGYSNSKVHRSNQCEPIIEEPATPEPEPLDVSEAEIEDAFWQDDPDDIPTIKLNLEEFTTNIQNFMNENKKGLQNADLSKALVALSPHSASIPMPKLKNVGRLRTEHQVYELPDSHPLLAEVSNVPRHF